MMKYLKWFVELITYLVILGLSGYVWILSLDPYAPPERNFALLLLSILILCYGVWRLMTRKEKLWIWQIF